MKRLFDLVFSLIGIVLTSPFLFIILVMVWNKDKSNPLYIANRVGVNGKEFKMFKVRTMVINADSNLVDSTSINDPRITQIGSFIRKYKIDELPQLINIFLGNMSFVGPRPSVKRDTDLYTKMERNIFKIKPGITDFASIVFSDESIILEGSSDPDLRYHQLIRPRKNKLALFYLMKNNLFMDVLLILITLFSLISRKKSLKMLCTLLKINGASKEIVDIASRKFPLVPESPPGSNKITKSRRIS